MLRVYAADVSGLDPEGEYPLSAYRREKLKKQKLPSAKRLGIGAELLLIQALETEAPAFALPLTIVCGENGKPALADSRLHFNLSHSGNYAACAVSDSPVGIDLQTEREHNEKLAERYFTAQERQFLAESTDKGFAFTEIWSRKESCVKLMGTGLKTPLGSFSVAPEPKVVDFEGKRLFFYHTVWNDCHLSVCSGDPAAVRSLKVRFLKL